MNTVSYVTDRFVMSSNVRSDRRSAALIDGLSRANHRKLSDTSF